VRAALGPGDGCGVGMIRRGGNLRTGDGERGRISAAKGICRQCSSHLLAKHCLLVAQFSIPLPCLSGAFRSRVIRMLKS
jgi:hypothetical protein